MDHANVIIRPPIIYLIPLAIGIILNAWMPLILLPDPLIGNLIGWPLLIAGIFLMVWALKIFSKGGEDKHPNTPTNKILKDGPYTFSRNPMYLAFNIIYVGIVLIVNTIWLIIFLPIAFIILHYGVVIREEQYMGKKFGTEYKKYKSEVRRWL